jgi:hypothetical protein
MKGESEVLFSHEDTGILMTTDTEELMAAVRKALPTERQLSSS